jgi:hypothetical protein
MVIKIPHKCNLFVLGRACTAARHGHPGHSTRVMDTRLQLLDGILVTSEQCRLLGAALSCHHHEVLTVNARTIVPVPQLLCAPSEFRAVMDE